MPWGIGACFRQTAAGRSIGAAGVFFATRTRAMADAERGFRYWRFVEFDTGELISHDLTILRRIDPDGGEPEGTQAKDAIARVEDRLTPTEFEKSTFPTTLT